MDPPSQFLPYLNTNYAPTENELHVLRGLISHHEAEAATLTFKIEETKKALVIMKSREKAHRKFIEEHSPLLSPIRRVPKDVLLLIFMECVEELWYNPNSRGNRECTHPKNPSNALSHVCGEWRTLVLHSPRLWSCMDVWVPNLEPLDHWGYHSDSDYSAAEAEGYARWRRNFERLRLCLKTWVTRSAPLGIRLMLDAGYIDQDMDEKYHVLGEKQYGKVMKLLRETASRWQEVQCYARLDPMNKAVVTLFDGPNLECPKLKKVTLNIEVDGGLPSDDAVLCMRKLTGSPLFAAPQLHDVSLDGVWGSIPEGKAQSRAPIYASVKHLVFKANFSDDLYFGCMDTLDLLTSLPQLVTVEIGMFDGGGETIAEVGLIPISLPALTSLTISPSSIPQGFGSLLSMPQLKAIHHSGYLHSQEQDDACGQAELLIQYARQLHHLTLNPACMTQPSLSRCMGELVNLVTLQLDSTMSGRSRSATSDIFVLSQLSVPGVCPRIEEFSFYDVSNFPAEGSTERAVVELFENKRPPPSACEAEPGTEGDMSRVWSCLRKVTMSFRHMQKVDILEMLKSREVHMDGIEFVVRYPTRASDGYESVW
ncbi:hypothetical protein NMY22_g15825 [Coprinellus aureogranulatus]|nr:hypothetical protein NMY22_g15825 [Coprinellus aureogranulatus]